MSENKRQQARRLFMELAELSASESSDALARACGGDAALRAEVEALLNAQRSAGAFLSHPTAIEAARESSVVGSPERERAGAQIDRYKLLEQIGEGGMGTIWMAEQREPVKRRVALKIIKLGMDTKQVIARFEAERQALALMDHPHIAKVLDAGATETGRPYFVMEYIKGIPILEYCDHAQLDTKARLELFTSVCHAIQHAHQKGIIHRDIKPSNVLVTLHDGVPVPKVIDFGIAKATNSELTTRTLFTEHRQMIGTPAYMSPEQAEMSGLDIDTRSDIYSLGVLLYELLTGTTPFDMKALLESGFAEMLRTIREVEPHKPSTRISTLGDTAARTAQQRHVDARKLGLLLRGDLDWIVMKCLEKDRSRRYETANGLAADIKRHLNDEPVTAGAPSASYRLRKFVKRNRAQVVAGGIVVAALVLGVIGTTLGLVRALDEKRRADGEANKARLAAASEAEAKIEAQQNERSAIESARRAEAAMEQETAARKGAETISEFVITTLNAGDAHNAGGGQDMTVLAAMQNAIRDIDSGRFADDPETEAGLKDTIARILLNNGRTAQAEALLVQALETQRRLHSGDDLQLAASLSNLGSAWMILGRVAEAEPLFVEALEMSQRLMAGDHMIVARGLDNLAKTLMLLGRTARAVELQSEALAMRRRLFDGDHVDLAMGLSNLALVWMELGRPAQAEPLFLEALEMEQRIFRGDHPDVAQIQMNLARARQALGRSAEAERLCIQALEMAQRLYEGDHPKAALALNDLADLRHAQGQWAQAEQLYVQALEMSQRLFPGDHPSVAVGWLNLAKSRKDQGQRTEAEPLYARALEMSERLFPGDHELVAKSLDGLAGVRSDLGRPAEVEPLSVRALEMARRLHQGDHPTLAMSLNNLGRLWTKLGRDAEAEPLLVQSLEMHQRLHQGDHPNVAVALGNVAHVRFVLGQPAESERLYLQSLEMNQRLYAGDHPTVAVGLRSLARVREAAGKIAQARQGFSEAVAMQRRLWPAGHPEFAVSLDNLASLLQTAGMLGEAEPIFREALETARLAYPAGHPNIAYGQTRLAGLLIAQSMFDEAEPLIRDALAIRETTQPEAWTTFNSKLQLGEVLLGQQKLAEAEPLLLAGYRGMKEREASIPPQGVTRIPEALERLVQLYEAKGDGSAAAAWRGKLEESRAGQKRPAADEPNR